MASCTGGDGCEDSGLSLPDGPEGIPLLGAALKWKGPETNLEWTQQYGPIYSVKIGSNQLVYLNTIELVEEYLESKGAAFLGRPKGPAVIANGLLFGQGERWAENRAAFTRALWHESVTQRYEAIIQEEVDLLLHELSSRLDQPLELDVFLLPALASRLVTLLVGERLDPQGKEMKCLVQKMQTLEEVDLTSKTTNLYLNIRRFRRPLEAVSRRTIPNMFKLSEAMQGLIQGWLQQRRTKLAENQDQPEPGVLIDQLITSTEYVDRSDDYEKELMQSIMDLFFGGVTSTLSALEFGVLYLIHHPDIQRKMKAEIDSVTKGGKPILWAERDRFPYTQATVIEVLRLGSVTPSSLPHVATQDVLIQDRYHVPKDVFVMGGIFSLHRDPRFFPDPEQFRPERHLDEEGKLVQPRSYRPFGIGERKCAGYNLAEIEIFLFIARLISAFRIRAQNPHNPPPFDTFMRIVRRLKPFKCVLEYWDT